MYHAQDADDDGKGKKKDSGKKKDAKKDKKDRGYTMFEPDDSQEESLVIPDEKDFRLVFVAFHVMILVVWSYAMANKASRDT